MSWKIYMIIISNAGTINTADIPAKIGETHLKPIREISIHDAQYAEGTSIGKFGDRIFIAGQKLVLKFYDKSPSDFEKRICDSFPGSEIAVLTLNGTSNLYGYSLIKNRMRQRIKYGADLDVYIDYGQKLAEEVVIAKEELFDREELEEIMSDNSKEVVEKIIDQEISIRSTLRLSKRYFGKQFDEAGSDFEKLMLTLYE